MSRDATLEELRALLQDWDFMDEDGKLSVLDRLTSRHLMAYWRVPTLPHIWVSDYPNGRPALRWSQEQQDLPCYCKHCHVPHDREKLNEECWARDCRTSRRVPCSE